MNKLKLELLLYLGPITNPFGRTPVVRKLLIGEDIVYLSFNASNGGVPSGVVFYNNTLNNIKESTYLWVIDKQGEILILLEQTINEKSPRGHICHTNITGGEPAYQGGEMWFIDNTTIVINQKSGRYGGTEEQMKYIIKYFELSGYNVKIAN